METIGTLITQYRMDANISRRQAARDMQMSSAWVLEKLERDKSKATPTQLRTLAAYYGVSVAPLIALLSTQPSPSSRLGATVLLSDLPPEETVTLPTRVPRAFDGIRYGSYDASFPAATVRQARRSFVHFQHYGG